MRPNYSITSQPAAEPVTYDQAADQLRVDSADDMEYIVGLISVAREFVDSVTGRASAQMGFLLTAEEWCDIAERPNSRNYVWYSDDRIPLFRAPLVTVESVSYYAPDETTLTVMPTTDYRVITTTEPGMIQITGDLPSLDDRPDAIQIAFTSGESCSANATIKHAIKLVVAHLYETRAPVAFTSCSEIPYTLKALIENQKVRGWF